MFFHKKKQQPLSYDTENKRPVLKCSICNGEQVAGFQDIHTKAFEEDMFVRNAADLEEFRQKYGITGEIGKIY
ncbi:MAG: aspartate dehydrogenase [Lachnospiraceae bacterium]|nr:aspartate dehydrogenase [Lachnospiraceae bacterium]